MKVRICLNHFCVVYNNWCYESMHSVPGKVKLIKSCFTRSLPLNVCHYSNNCTLVLSITKCLTLFWHYWMEISKVNHSNFKISIFMSDVT
jgi:hypothetical protein